MTDAFVYDAVRTPRGKGKADGSLHEVTALKLATQALGAIKDRNLPDPALVDDVVLGCVDPVGEAGGDIARAAALTAGYGNTVAGVQINRFCASGLDAINFASAQVMSGQHDMTIGGGVESMSRVGMGASGGAWPMDPAIAIPTYFLPQGISADLIATKYGFSRDDVDAYAVESQKRSKASWDAGNFKNSVIAGEGHQRHHDPRQGRAHAADHDDAVARRSCSPRSCRWARCTASTRSRCRRYPEVETVTHVHHAGNSSGIVDGAAAVLIGNKEAGAKIGKKPRARIRAFANIGSEPAIMLTGPIDVTEKVLKKAGMKIEDIDLFELNEAFASVVLRYMQALNIPHDKINVAGGAIAMGHPLGATGAMIFGTVLDELERRNLNTALVTLCIGAGMGTRRSSSGCERSRSSMPEDRRSPVDIAARNPHRLAELSAGLQAGVRGPPQDRARQCGRAHAVRREPDEARAGRRDLDPALARAGGRVRLHPGRRVRADRGRRRGRS